MNNNLIKLSRFIYYILLTLFIFFFGYWVYLHYFASIDDTTVFDIYTYTYAVIALLGSIIGFVASKIWGFPKSVLGKSLFLFSLGLLFQFIGQQIYNYYYGVLGIEPYPSPAEFFFFGSIPIYIAAIWYMSIASGMKFSLKKSNMNMAILIGFPLLMIIFAYSYFLTDYDTADKSLVELFLDFGYPIGQAIQASLVILAFYLNKDYLGGKMKKIVFYVLFAVLMQYIADIVFTVRENYELWEPGDITDLLYLISYFSMALALYKFKRVHQELKDMGSK